MSVSERCFLMEEYGRQEVWEQVDRYPEIEEEEEELCTYPHFNDNHWVIIILALLDQFPPNIAFRIFKNLQMGVNQQQNEWMEAELPF
ncbi:MAG: hypothetical protein GY705_09910 [Bacteroidetes bacterium]|nr:hypothetical protein [Bacteroidota bacterium]